MTKTSNCLNKNKDKATINKPLRCVNIFLSSLLLFGIGFYLFNISQLATQGFVLRELKFEKNSLLSQKSELEEQLSFVQSYYSLNSRVAKLNMVEVNDLDYLKINATVAKK